MATNKKTETTFTLGYTLTTLAQRLNSSPEAIAERVKLSGRLPKVPESNDAIADNICQSMIGAYDMMAGKQTGGNNVIALPQASGASQESSPESNEPIGELARVKLSDIKEIAKQFEISQSLARELEEAAFQRNLALLFYQEQVRADAVDNVIEAVQLSRQMQRIERQEKATDAAEAALLAAQDANRIENLDAKFDLGLQSTIDALKEAAQKRAAEELKRSQWLEDIKAGREIPAEALTDPFVKYASLSQRTA